MDAAVSSSSERARELAALRTRAYGPDADIQQDSAAVARLLELEDLVRAEDVSSPASEVAAAAPDASAPAPVASVVATGTQAGGARTRGRRRPPTWVLVLGAAAAGLGLGLVVPGAITPHPQVILRSVPLDGAAIDFDIFGVTTTSTVRYAPFYDLTVWSAETEAGSTCVFVTDADGAWMAAGCAPEQLAPTADLTYYPGMTRVDGLQLPDFSVVRFILRAGTVEVWIAETDDVA
ncbi:hypothetical protein NQ152_08805 [Microbacterium sp. zg.B48]|uniref:hypothetical protein n=1 Tax=Microbacterium sp. zg.B48 TaxID=2969408 RepID=UPI00214CF088|nr:hypothetical protein [Microbacterium sp. zg.B48]MCR2763607.1 hypothetical protein [Microbacterium sp. zg.B48]